MSEPYTHYDLNDSHGYRMHDVLDPGDTAPDGSQFIYEDATDAEVMDRLAGLLESNDLIYIDGFAYQLVSYGDEDSQGHRNAKLKLWRPF